MSNISIPFLRRRVSPDIVNDYFHNALEKWSEVYKRNVRTWKYYDVDRFKIGVITTLLGDLYMGWPEELGEPTDEKWELLSKYLLELYSDEMTESYYSIRKKNGLNNKLNESKNLRDLFLIYMDRYYSEYKNLDMASIYRSIDGVSMEIIGWRFRDNSDTEIFRWFDTSHGSTLYVNQSFYDKLEDMFGEESYLYLIDWFKKAYNMEVSSFAAS